MSNEIVRLGRIALVGAVVLAVVTACNDAPTNDTDRGYTKAPLEEPGLVVQQEPHTPMTRVEAPLRQPRIFQNGFVMPADSQLPAPPAVPNGGATSAPPAVQLAPSKGAKGQSS